MSYLAALGLTLATEAPIVWFGYRGRAPLWRIALVFVIANLFTHGLLWWLWDSLPGAYAARLAGAELVVFLVEAALYRELLGGSAARALAVSAAANALSTGLGLILWSI